MAIYNVTKVRKEAPAQNPSHEHIVGLVTDDGAYHTNQEVAESIRAGNTWQTLVSGETALIGVDDYCGYKWCMHAPYLRSTPGPSLATDLEKLPRG